MKLQDKLRNFSKIYIQWLSKNYIKTMIVFGIISIMLSYFAFRIPLDARIYNLFPQDLESIKSNQKLEQYHGGEGYLIATISYNHPYREFLKKIEFALNQEESFKIPIGDLKNFYQSRENQDLSPDMSAFNKAYYYLARYYKDFDAYLTKQNFPDHQYTQLFKKEFLEIIVPETVTAAKEFKNNPSLNTLEDFSAILKDNERAFNLYSKKIRELSEDKTQELIELAQIFGKKAESNKKMVFYTNDYFSEQFVEDHLLYFLDIQDLQYIHDEIQNKIDYERRKSIIAKSLLIDGEKKDYELNFQDLKNKYFPADGSSFKLIRVLNGEEALKTKYDQPKRYYLNKNHDTLVVLIKAAKGSPDIAFGQKLMKYLNSISYQIKKDYPQYNNLDINFYGRYKDRSEDVKIINKDFKTISPIAILVLFVIIFIHFRSWQAVVVVCLPLLSDVTWALGIAYYTIGSLNLISSFIIAIMAGLGVNFGTHLFNRYIEERIIGHSVVEALTIVFQQTFISNLTATTTSAAGFFVLGTSQFQGFSEFGIIAGTAMLCLVVGILLVFPSIIFLLERYKGIPLNRHTNKDKLLALKNKPMPYFKLIIIGAMVMSIISFIGFKKVPFNANFTTLISQNRSIEENQESLKQAESIIGFYNLVPMVIYAPNYETMQEVTKYILNKDSRYTDSYRIESLYNYIPDDQEEKQVWLKKINDQLNQEILNSVSDKESKQSIQRLKELTKANPTTLANTPDIVKDLFKSSNDGYFIFFYPTASISRIKNISNYSKEIEEIAHHFKDKGVFGASDTMIFNDIFNIILKEAPIMLSSILFFFLILLWLDFRNWKKVFVSLIPLTVGISWILGFYYLFGFQFNYFNIVMFPVIIAIGLDDGVHLLHRYHEEGLNNIRYIFANTGRSIFIAGIQDIIGFSAFLLAFYVGLNTIGQFLTIGVLSCMLVSTMVLPSVLQLIADIKTYGLKKAIFSLRGIIN